MDASRAGYDANCPPPPVHHAAGDYAVIVAKEGSASVAVGVQTARDTLQSTVDKAREAADPDVALNMAWEAWTK